MLYAFRRYRLLSSGLLLLAISACGGGHTHQPSSDDSSGTKDQDSKPDVMSLAIDNCRLDRAIELGISDLRLPVAQSIILNDLKFDQAPVSETIQKVHFNSVELQIFQYEFQHRPSGFIAAALQSPEMENQYMSGLGFDAGASCSNCTETERKFFPDGTTEVNGGVTTYTTEYSSSRAKGLRTTKVVVKMVGTELIALQLTLPTYRIADQTRDDDGFTGVNQTLCLKSARFAGIR